jgi:hypothetical protein
MHSLKGTARKGPLFGIGCRGGWQRVMIGLDCEYGAMQNDGYTCSWENGNPVINDQSYDALVLDLGPTLWYLPSHRIRLGFGPGVFLVTTDMKGELLGGYGELASGLSWHCMVEGNIQLYPSNDGPLLLFRIRFGYLDEGGSCEDCCENLQHSTRDRFTNISLSVGFGGSRS